MKDGYTIKLTQKINDWGFEKIGEIEDDLENLKNKVPEIIDYLKDIHFSMPLGLALRRYICEFLEPKYDSEKHCYIFDLPEKTIVTKDYDPEKNENYDIENDDISEYIELFNYINKKYNSDENGNLTLVIPRAEVRRQLRATTVCLREKMFLLSFALHMNNEYTSKFLTDVLAEQTYNYREPTEIIAYFCQSHDEFNNYPKYLELCKLFEDKSKGIDVSDKTKEQYTSFARTKISKEIDTVDELMEFLLANIANFHKFSQTAYLEFLQLYKKAGDNIFQHTGNTNGKVDLNDVKEWIEHRRLSRETGKEKNSVADDRFIYPEQLAEKMLACIPRASFKSYKKEDKEKKNPKIRNDFIQIYNGEKGQNSKKVKTTELPKSITMNLPISDRLWDLIKQEKPVTRKDLVFMKFYVFSQYLEEKECCTVNDYYIFLAECNNMLLRCGMSRLYPGNRFENLIMLSLLASQPYEMFENIIDYSFMNEPEANYNADE